jgi:hypothetical protein
MARQVKRQDIIFQCKILKAKFLFQKEWKSSGSERSSPDATIREPDKIVGKNVHQKNAIKQLKLLLKQTKDDYQIAILHYELFKMTGKKTDKNKALALYHKLYKKTLNIQYKEKMKELRNS